MDVAERTRPEETGDSQADICPTCNGAGKFPPGTQRAGQTCDTCAGAGALLRQRRDANGNPTRVRIVDAKNPAANGSNATGSATTTADAGSASTATS